MIEFAAAYFLLIICKFAVGFRVPESDEDSESVTRKPNRHISFILRPRDKFI